MVTDELVAIIQEKFKKGQRRNEIKEDLMYEGYPEEDIDDTISHIQHTALKQLPLISSIYQLIDDFESKPNLTTPKMTAVLMIACVAVLLLLAGGLYVLFDPLGTRSAARDAQRAEDSVTLQKAIDAYYKKNYQYPNSLNNLVPEFLPTVPHDPQSGTSYSYKAIDGSTNYQLCIAYEVQIPQCVNAKPVINGIPVIPTATPIPPFVPQSASGAATTSQGL